MRKETKTPNANELKKQATWLEVDASDQILGRLATSIAKKLLGKDKPNYVPNMDMGDNVVVINAAKIVVTGDKMNKKIYYRHTGFPGGFRSQLLKEVMSNNPAEVLRRAVEGMLPKNRLRKQRISNLYIYNDANHPHKANVAGGKDSK